MQCFTILVAHSGRLAAVAAALLLNSVAQPAVAEVLHWEVAGRVAEISDPDAIFGDVAVNDPVLGHFFCDTSLEPQYFFGLAFYMGECSPDGPVLVVNPGEAGELAFATPASGGEPLFTVGDDSDDPELGGTVDFFSAEYLVEPPTGYQGADPVVVFSFAGDDPVHSLDLPTSLNLQDWPMSEVFFTDYSADDVSPFGEIVAEIESVRRVVAGDFDDSGWVDGQDFLIWQRGDSPHPLDAADLADWASHFGTGPNSPVVGSSTIPEPAAWILLALGTMAAMFRRIVVASRFTDLHRQTGDSVRNELP